MLEVEDIINILTLGGAFMLGLLFFTVSSSNKGNIFLGLFLWNITYMLLKGVLEDLHEINLQFNGLLFILVFLFLYLITTINRPFKKWYLLLFIPGIIHNSANFTPSISENDFFQFIDLLDLFYVFELVLIIYFFRILKKHRIKLNNYYSNMELKTLSWLKVLVFLVLLLHFSWTIEGIIPEENEILETISNSIPALIMFGMVYWIGFNGFSQSEIFKDGFFSNVNTEDKKELNTANLDITIAKFELLKEKIIIQRLYAKHNLSLRDLAFSVNMKEKEISSLIKLHTGTTFYHFINGFRIEEFKRSLNSSKSAQLSIFGLAQEVGFASKSTFYNAFNTVEGMTPKQYQSTLKEFD
ncbi:AraC family transcriptional regulator [uncultured Tenacibaculum sp.]|uniref:helix-turn-helix domain-containing protein n=1 Tax=uncultured Tenacibaculum sp. TaxID=174713 RepID=UPI002618E76B|nr:AraC family transcriptional regulator [uncultured Tenacibaculum sp.]